MVGKTSNSATKQPIPQEAFDWYDEYAHGKIDRREFLNRLAGLAVLGFSVATLSEALCRITQRRSKCRLMTPISKPVIKRSPHQKAMAKAKAI